MRSFWPVLMLLLVLCGATAATGESYLMRYADIHGNQIVFTYEDDLWLVPSSGGNAHRITHHPGTERYAKFSPDGEWIAFSGEYDGGYDIYVMPAAGGVPRRLTYHPSGDRMLEWYPDGTSILFRSRRAFSYRAEEVYRISVDGGMPERLPIDRGGLASLSGDATKLAYNRISRETRTWKRYQGGMAQDIWLANFTSGEIRKITDWVGTDNYPMWYGDGIYFTSDRNDGTLNLFRHDAGSGEVTTLTRYRDYDVKYPSVGDGRIVFQYGEELHVLDLASGAVRKIDVHLPTDLVHMRPELVEISPRAGSFGLSPSGKRVLLEARGEILNLSAEEGDPINLTDTSASREKNAAWSPDGRWIAFVSDRSGDEEIYLIDQKGQKEWRQLTRGGKGFLMPLVWSPDSKYLLYSDKFMRLNLLDAKSGKVEVIDQSDTDDAWERWGIQDYVWSPCSQWIAYTKMEKNLNESIFLYSLDSGRSTRVTGVMTTDWSPSFDPDGRYLYFLSNRTFNPTMGFQDQTHVFLEMGRAYVVILQDDQLSPFVPEDTEEEVKDEDGEDDDEKGDKTDEDDEEDDGEDSDEVDPTEIDLDGIGRRIVAADGVESGNYFRLEATADGFLLLRKDEPEFSKYQSVTDETGGELELLGYDLEEAEISSLMTGIANYHLSADGERMIYRAGSNYGVVDTGSKASVGDDSVDLSGVRLRVVRGEEFRQIFDEAWRVQRDWFYDAGLHGVDWKKAGDKYRRFVMSCGTRGDLNYLIGELIAELNIGHTYIFGGDHEDGADHVNTGLLGVTFTAGKGDDFYRIDHIIPGVSWEPAARSPLAEPGCPVGEGDYLIAIDGNEVRVGDNVYRHLVDRAGRMVTLTYNDRPSAKDAKTHRLQPIGGEYLIRYREWVEKNRAAVDAASKGGIAYLHLPDMSRTGLIEFGKAFYPQAMKRALIIDERYNGGGFVGDMIIDRLERRIWGITVPREGITLRDPERVFHGPIVVLVNEDTGSNGEYFAEAIKIKGLATVMGVRTWGGAVGIEPHQDLVDGAMTTPPQFGIYGLDRKWLIEGHGVEPDVVVQNLPADVVAGKDAQLTAAIEYLLRILDERGGEWVIPPTPEFPDKSKAGE